jgi:hypothetical protein
METPRFGRRWPGANSRCAALAGVGEARGGVAGLRFRPRPGLAYVETDPVEADATTIVHNLLHGQYERPLRVLTLNADEGWARDVSEAIAAKVRDAAEHDGRVLTSGTLAFIEAHVGRAIQPTLPLW